MKNVIHKKSLQYIVVYVITLAVLIIALVGTTAIPNEAIYDNMLKSAEEYRYPSAYQLDESGKLRGITDNYADNILLNVLWNMKSDTPLKSALDTRYYDGGENGLNWGLHESLINNVEANTDYTRYWHGMVVFLRPLHLWFTMSEIKWIGLGAAILLLVTNVLLLLKKKQFFAAAALPLSYAGVQFWLIVRSVEYQPAIIISLLMSLIFIAQEKKGVQRLICLSVVSGVLISFFDFLTTETLTILVPLALVLLVRQAEDRLGPWKENLKWLFKAVLAWGISYGMTFVAKWSVASLVLGENKFLTAFSSAAVRVAGTDSAESQPLYLQIPFALLGNLSTMFGGTARVDFHSLFVGLSLTLVVFGAVFYLLRGNYQKDITILMLALGVIPYIRFLVLNNHSYLHEFFTYRAQAVSILALLSILWYNTDRGLLKGKRKPQKRAKSTKAKKKG